MKDTQLLKKLRRQIGRRIRRDHIKTRFGKRMVERIELKAAKL